MFCTSKAIRCYNNETVVVAFAKLSLASGRYRSRFRIAIFIEKYFLTIAARHPPNSVTKLPIFGALSGSKRPLISSLELNVAPQ